MKYFSLYGSLILGVGLTILADVLLKRGTTANFIAGVLIYGSVAIPVAIAFQFTTFGRLFIIWEGLYILIGLGVATWIYGEPFTTRTFVALCFALAAMLLVDN